MQSIKEVYDLVWMPPFLLGEGLVEMKCSSFPEQSPIWCWSMNVICHMHIKDTFKERIVNSPLKLTLRNAGPTPTKSPPQNHSVINRNPAKNIWLSTKAVILHRKTQHCKKKKNTSLRILKIFAVTTFNIQIMFKCFPVHGGTRLPIASTDRTGALIATEVL